MTAQKLLLDTCAIIWLANDAYMESAALEAITSAGESDDVFVSAASAWEIGLLSRPRPNRPPIYQFLPDPKTWFARIVSAPGIRPSPITTAIALDAAHLPGDLHNDPADRLLIATARQLGAALVTRDRKILDYAGAGFVDAIAC